VQIREDHQTRQVRHQTKLFRLQCRFGDFDIIDNILWW
jgi:hypothetical protein